ncbi:ribosome recycling factor [Xylocopilactobacillus apicola]|uniref:Ribosome-recycling factor n=1 Tax=Xylocopilactobacillus apicola TaxID=2932184 RepID=A0AAU9D3Q0_9LACO|nr:ribosome recycling factor [Xylocopilactobacillus apicola]BDR58389.1 ribosome-recycling factor [Xylocopilactobacillus apicola]
MNDEIISKMKTQMKKTSENLELELGRIRAGRANASLVNDIMVDYYGTPTPLGQIASVSTPEARLIQITPFDKTALKGIEAAINMSDLGINPTIDNSMIRLVIPQLTGESRKDLVKEVKKYAEESKVAVRNARRDAIDALKKEKKNGDISEDVMHQKENEVQKQHDEYIKKIDEIAANKEKEITTI